MYLDIYDDIYEYMFSEYNFKLLNGYMIVKERLTVKPSSKKRILF